MLLIPLYPNITTDICGLDELFFCQYNNMPSVKPCVLIGEVSQINESERKTISADIHQLWNRFIRCNCTYSAHRFRLCKYITAIGHIYKETVHDLLPNAFLYNNVKEVMQASPGYYVNYDLQYLYNTFENIYLHTACMLTPHVNPIENVTLDFLDDILRETDIYKINIVNCQKLKLDKLIFFTARDYLEYNFKII